MKIFLMHNYEVDKNILNPIQQPSLYVVFELLVMGPHTVGY